MAAGVKVARAAPAIKPQPGQRGREQRKRAGALAQAPGALRLPGGRSASAGVVRAEVTHHYQHPGRPSHWSMEHTEWPGHRTE